MRKIILLSVLFFTSTVIFAANDNVCNSIDDPQQKALCNQLVNNSEAIKQKEAEKAKQEAQAQAAQQPENIAPPPPTFKMQQPKLPKLPSPQLVGPQLQQPTEPVAQPTSKEPEQPIWIVPKTNPEPQPPVVVPQQPQPPKPIVDNQAQLQAADPFAPSRKNKQSSTQSQNQQHSIYQ